MMKLRTTFFLIIFISGITIEGQAQIMGKVETESGNLKYLESSVVYIDYVDGDFQPPSNHPVMDQKGLNFSPHILPVVKGTTVDFLNSDDVLHNVFSPDRCAGKFNLGTWGKSETRSHTYDKTGCESVVLCNVHPEMEAYVLVLQNPFFAVVDENGNYRINNVPPGEYTLKVWNERLVGDDHEIKVGATGKASVNFKLTK